MQVLSTNGRSGRARLVGWLGIVVAVAALGIIAMRDGPLWSAPLTGGIWGLVLAKLVIEAMRRRHDAGRSAKGLTILLMLAIVALTVGVGVALLLGQVALLYAALLVFVALILSTLLAPVHAMTNRWGAVPPSASRSSFGEGGSGLGAAITIALTALGASAGYLGMAWVQGMANAQARAQGAAERPPVIDPGEGPPLENLEAIYQRQQRGEGK